MVKEDADQHLHHFSGEFKGELRSQDQLQTKRDKKEMMQMS